MRHHHVRRDVTSDVQERAQLAPGPGARVRKHPHRAVRQQSRHQGQKGQGQVDRVPQEEEPAGKRCDTHTHMQTIFPTPFCKPVPSIVGALHSLSACLFIQDPNTANRTFPSHFVPRLVQSCAASVPDIVLFLLTIH